MSHFETNKQTNRQTDRQTNKQTDKQTNKQTNKQTENSRIYLSSVSGRTETRDGWELSPGFTLQAVFQWTVYKNDDQQILSSVS